MKPHPPPPVPGNTEAERVDNAVRKIFSVSKDEFLKAEEEHQRTKPPRTRYKKTEQPTRVR